MYFKQFPSFLYDFKYEDGSVRTEVLKDITRNIRVKKDILSNISVYDSYDLADGDTPEIIAEKYYGNPEYHWIVMLTNEQFDWLSDFPMTETEIVKHIKRTYNPVLHSNNWYFGEEYSSQSGVNEVKLFWVIYDNPTPFDPDYITAQIDYTISGKTTDVEFSYSFTFPDIRHGEPHNDLNMATQTFWQILPYPIGKISSLTSTNIVSGTNTAFTTNLFVGMTLFTKSGVKIGKIKSIESDSQLTLTSNSTVAITNVDFDYKILGTPVGDLTITTTGRENNPVLFVNSQGYIINPTTPGAIPVSGDTLHREDNDRKRRIKLVAPSLIETVIKNYEEML